MATQELTIAEARKRLAEIDTMAASGDFSWEFDEMIRLRRIIPETVAEDAKMWKNHHAASRRVRK